MQKITLQDAARMLRDQNSTKEEKTAAAKVMGQKGGKVLKSGVQTCQNCGGGE